MNGKFSLIATSVGSTRRFGPDDDGIIHHHRRLGGDGLAVTMRAENVEELADQEEALMDSLPISELTPDELVRKQGRPRTHPSLYDEPARADGDWPGAASQPWASPKSGRCPGRLIFWSPAIWGVEPRAASRRGTHRASAHDGRRPGRRGYYLSPVSSTHEKICDSATMIAVCWRTDPGRDQ